MTPGRAGAKGRSSKTRAAGTRRSRPGAPRKASRDDVVEALVGTKVPCGKENTHVIEVLGPEGALAIVKALEAAGFDVSQGRTKPGKRSTRRAAGGAQRRQ